MAAQAHLPRQVPIEAYGNGGFRFGGMSHKGSLLCLPTGIWGWPATSVGTLDLSFFDLVFAVRDQIGFLLLGAGAVLTLPPRELRKVFQDAGLGLEVMDTGAAARTYNVLLAEGRPIAAALIAVA